MKPNKKQLVFEIEKMMEVQKEYIKSFSNDNNPQVKALYLEAIAKYDALEDVLIFSRKELRK